MENQKSILTFENGRFFFTPKNKVHKELAKGFALKNDATTSKWVTRNIHKAKNLRAFADQSAEIKFKKHFITEYKRPEFIVYPDHLQPKNFQMETAWHILTRSPAYVADEQGLGKTISSILAMSTSPGPTLIICPPYLKYNWSDEICGWYEGRLQSITIAEGDTDFETIIPDVVILPDSILSNNNILQYIRRQEFKWLFIDEAHRFKDPTSKRTKALIEIAVKQAERIVYLSGTPIPNGRPIELYPILSETAPEVIEWAGKKEFGNMYCDAREVIRYEGNKAICEWDYNGATNMRQFGEALRSKFMIRHLKCDVLKELPPKTRQFIFLDKPKSILPFEEKVLNQYTPEELEDGDNSDRGAIATFRRECGLLKIKPAAELIIDTIEAHHQPLIISAFHIEVVEGLAASLKKYNPIMIRGGLAPKKKQALIEEWKEDKGFRPLVGNYDSIGVGLTLTRAKKVICVEYSWVPGINDQMEDRIHRISQEGNTYFQYLVLRNSLDERQLRSTFRKQKNIARAI